MRRRALIIQGLFLLAWLADILLGSHEFLRCDPIFTPGILISMAISAGASAASYGLQYALADRSKPPPVDRGRLDDIRISIAGYNEHILKGWGKFRGAPVWVWDSRVIHTTITTPGQSGGKGMPRPPGPSTTDHIYTKSLAGAI